MSVDFAKLVIQADSSELKLLRDRLKDVDGQAPKTASSIKDLEKGVKVLGVATAAALTAITKFGADFDKAMSGSLAIMGDVSEEMREEMRKTAREVSASVEYSAKEAAEAYYFLAAAGMDAAQSIEALPRVVKFAQAGMFDLATATDLVTDAQSALGLASKDTEQNIKNLTRVSDVLVKANTLANASVQQFSEALTNKAAAALRNVGKDIEEGVAVLAAFADQGLKGAAAGESLNIVMRDLQKASIDNRKEFVNAGIAVYDLDGNMRGLADIIGELENRLGSMSDEQKRTELSTLGFQDRSISAMMSLMGTSDAIRDYEKQLRDAGGTTDEIADKQLQNFWSQLNLVKNELMNTAIVLWESIEPAMMNYLIPALQAGVSNLKTLVGFIQSVPPEFHAVGIGAAGLVTTMGPLLLILPKISAALVTVKTSAVGLSTFLLTNPFGVGILALGSLAAAAVSAKNALDDLKTAEQLNFETDNITREVRELWELKTEIEETIQSLENLRGTSFFGPKTQQELADAYNNLEVVKQMLIDTNREIQGLGKDPEPALDDLNKAFKEIEENIRSIVDAQKLEMDAEARAIAELQKRNEAEKEFNALLSEKEQIMNSLISPMDKLAQEQARIIELRKMGILTEYEMIRALKSTEEQMEALVEQEKEKLNNFNLAQQREIDSLYSGLLTQEELIKQSYDRRRELILNSTAVTEEEKKDLLERLTEETNKKLRGLNYQQAKDNIGAYEQMFSGIMAATYAFGGEQSDFYKAMFLLHKLSALANANVAIAEGAAESSKVGWPQNIATIAGHIATTAPILASIAGAFFAGEFAGGGRIPSGQWGIVGETGKPEIVHGPATVTGVNETEELLRGRNETHLHFHIGTLVSDGRGEKEFVRRIMPTMERELQRIGKS